MSLLVVGLVENEVEELVNLEEVVEHGLEALLAKRAWVLLYGDIALLDLGVEGSYLRKHFLLIYVQFAFLFEHSFEELKESLLVALEVLQQLLQLSSLRRYFELLGVELFEVHVEKAALFVVE